MSLVITDAGIAASIQAGELGVQYKITHISIGSEGYEPTTSQTELRNEILRKALTRGEQVSLGRLHFETVWDGKEEFEGKELGYWLEDGTLFAVDSRNGEVITYKRADTVVTEAVELNLSASSISNITVELMGSPLATERVAGIAKIASIDQVNEGTDDRSFLTIKKLVHSLSVPLIIDKLVSNLWMKLAAKIFPVGAAIPWFSDIAPDGFAIMKNQAYDTNVYTELAKIWPNGVIPDMRGCGVIGKEDGEIVGIFEEGQVKEHGHDGSMAISTDLGSKTTSTDTHAHNYMRILSTGGGYAAHGGGYFGNGQTTSDSHNHVVGIGSHVHALMITLFGGAKNTINHRKVNWIVRMA